MSLATLENQDLTLSSLTISNAEYSNVSGYVPSQASFTSSKTSTSLNVNTVSAVSQVIAPSFQLSLGGSTTSKPALSTNSANNMVVSTATGAGLTLSSNNGGVCSFIPQVGYLAVSETIDVDTLQLSGNGATTKPFLSTNSANNCVISTGVNAGLTLSNTTTDVSLIPGNGYLSITEPVELEELRFTGNSATAPPYISTNSFNNMVLSVPVGSGITISSASGNGTLTVNSSNQLLWNGVIIS